MEHIKEEFKLLLLKDLCARLPYGVKIELMPITRGKCVTLTPIILRDYFISDDVNYLPYLRPMSSMTADEEEQWGKFIVPTSYFDYENDGLKAAVFWDELSDAIDWLNAHHFDYRGLIEKGLAIEAPKGMYGHKQD